MPETEEELYEDLYVSGIVDSKGEFRVEVSKSEQAAQGYRITPKFMLHTDRALLVQFLDDWFLNRGIFANIEERDKSAYRISIKRNEHIERMIDVLSPHLIATADDARKVFEIILPNLEEALSDKEVFIELVEVIETMDSFNPQRKYDSEYFRDEWDL
jgi:hypothetical protein